MGKRWQDMEENIDKAREAARHGDKKAGGGERERLTWRERDARRGQSTHTNQDRDDRDRGPHPKDRYANELAQKQAKANLEELFRDKKGDSLKKDILDADRVDLQPAIDAWIEAKGSLPSDDAELLDKCLDVRRDKTLRLVVDAISQGLAGFDDAAKKVLVLKLRSKARRTFDARLGRQIKALLAEHGADG
jgi:hypothetical protein